MSTIKEILAAIGLTVLAFGLGWAISEQHTRTSAAAAYAPIQAARDSLAKVAASSQKQDAAHAASLDSALSALAHLTAQPDTVQVPVHVPLVFTDSAALLAMRDSLVELRAVSQQVANACIVVERDCAAVRAQRDSLLKLTAPAMPKPVAPDTSTRLTALAGFLYDPIAKVAAGRAGAAFRIGGGWSVTAEADRRLVRGDSLRFYVGAVKQWSIW